MDSVCPECNSTEDLEITINGEVVQQYAQNVKLLGQNVPGFRLGALAH